MRAEAEQAAHFALPALQRPAVAPPLDAGFRPAALATRRFREGVASAGGGEPLLFALERDEGAISRFETVVYPADHPRAPENRACAERLLKFLLWQRGGWRVHVSAPEDVFNYLAACYAPGGARSFDYHFLGEQVYRRPFSLVRAAAGDLPRPQEAHHNLGRHLDGCRIGFDLGASDLKVSAVIGGEAIFSQEIEWQPRIQSDPGYHKKYIRAALSLAASKLPRLDAIGGSSAGIYIDNRPMVASLFRAIPAERFEEVRNLFLDIGAEMGVPLVVVNDGDVAALAGSMGLEANAILGIALGSSQAAGYVTPDGRITGYLNELAFAPVDYSPEAPIEEWSRDRGCGASYFSQQAVFRLAPQAGIAVPDELSPAKKLEFVQAKLEAGHEGAERIWQTIGVYLGYGVAHYADFYDLRHVLLLGRCTSGRGGGLILEGARSVLAREFPELAARVTLHLPDEQSRRVGQAIAAASLPVIGKRPSRP
jgi:predicted NBD/HSP70 family sugar kinase